MKHRKIYDIIRERSPISVCDDPELLEQFEDISLEELMEDLEDLYQEWGALPKLFRARKKEDLQKIGECESLFAFILEEIFSYGDPSVIPQLLKYVPSDDEYEDEDLVFLEDYSSEPLCNGITEVEHFGEAYIPVLLSHIHEIVPRALQNAAWFLYGMIYDDLITFFDSRPLMINLQYAQKEPFLCILEYAFQSCLESLKKKDEKIRQLVMEKIQYPIENINNDDDGVVQVAYLRQQFLKLHAVD
jgi:hypothetical protein